MAKRKSKILKVIKKRKSKKKTRQQHGKSKKPSAPESEPKCARDELGRILPGNTANPGGRPLGRYSLTTILENILKKQKGKSKQTQGEKLMKALFKYAKEGDSKLLALIMERIDGKVPDRVITTDTGPLSDIDEDKLQQIIDAGRPDRGTE